MSPLNRAFASSVIALGLIATPAIAYAGTGDVQINTGSGWVNGTTTPLFDISGIVPGWADSRTIEVRNMAGATTTLALSATDIVEDENGCNGPEAVVDSTCGADQGELGHELELSVYLDPENDGIFEATPRWSGTLHDLASPATLLNGLGGGGVVGLKIVIALPGPSGNETQTDDVDFSFRLTLAGVGEPSTTGTTGGSGVPSTGPGAGTTTPQGPGSVEVPPGPGSVVVKGIKATRHPHPGVLHDITSQLPFTGTPLERLVAGGLWLVIVGTALSMLARVRRRRRTAPY